MEAILAEEGEEWNAFPLSFAQARLWFLDRLAPGAAIYNIAGALDLNGPLEIPALHAALAAAVERHEILQTRFVTVRGVALQVIGPGTVPPLPLADLSGLPELPIQYADYAVWERESLAEDAAEARLATLRQRLEGVPPLELPTDRPRPPVARFHGARRPVALDSALVAELAALVLREGTTLFGGLSAAFAAVLSRFSARPTSRWAPRAPTGTGPRSKT